MVKVHTRVKRHLTSRHHGRNRKPRAKTFRSEEAAQAWAKENNVLVKGFENLKDGLSKAKKIRILTA